MCGRFVLYSPAKTIIEEFRADKAALEYTPNYNIAPAQNIVIVKKDGTRILTQCKWGLIPSWAKDPAIGCKTINARAETVATKPAFRSAFENQRCLVVADGFYEWRSEGKVKTPVYIRLKSGKPFGFAGLYSLWTSPKGDEICTCTIITTDANELLAPIHDRMPVIISKDNYDLWLDPGVRESKALLPLLACYPSDAIEFKQVSSLVNSPKNNSPDLIKGFVF